MRLAELLISIFVFVLVSTSVYFGFQSVMNIVSSSKAKTLAVLLINEKFEIIRNMPYESIGIINGIPVGSLKRFDTWEKENFIFNATTTVRNIDDSFDGMIGGTPNDLSPADYKLVVIDVYCANCKNKFTTSLSTVVAPNSLETSSSNGALFVKVFDSNGQPIQGATVKIINSNLSPTINIEEVTDNNGVVQIVDAPPSSESYEIEVSKIGYSKEKTYAYGSVENPNPIKPHATVVLQQITQSSFSIDRTGTINVSILDNQCQAISGENFSIAGSRLIGINPNIYSFATTSYYVNSFGSKSLYDLAWDTYNLVLNSDSRFLAGTIPILPISLSPQSVVNVSLLAKEKQGSAFLLTVLDNSTSLPISGADVSISSGGFSDQRITGQGAVVDSQWSQNVITEGLQINEIQNTVSLLNMSDAFTPSGEMISRSFDLGTSSDIYNIFWNPEDQSTGPESVKIQIAANNDNSSWNFIGPDGTSNSYYTVSGQSVYAISGYRYIKYKLILSTNNLALSPSVSSIYFTYSSPCSPPGQTYFDDLSSGTYNITVNKTGYTQVNTERYLGNDDYAHLKINLSQ